MRLFDTDGIRVGSEMMVNQSSTGYQAYPVVDVNDSGRVVIAWEGNGTQAGQIDSYGVFTRSYQLTPDGDDQHERHAEHGRGRRRGDREHDADRTHEPHRRRSRTL